MKSSSAPRSRTTEWFIFLLLLLCYAYFLPRWADWNVNSRFDLVLAAVDNGTLKIDQYVDNTGDYAYFENHYYSDKAPGTSFFGIPLYWLFENAGGHALVQALTPHVTNAALRDTLDPNGRGMLEQNLYMFAALTFVTFLVIAIPSALLGVLLYRMLLVWSVRTRDALILTLAYGLATPAFAYANNLYGHQLAAVFLFAAFYFVFQAARGVRPTAYPLLVGFLFGLALITEYPAALIVGGIGLYAIYKWRNIRQIILICVAAIPPLLLMAVYNFAIFRTPIPVGYWYSALYTDLHHTGLISLTYPKFDALFDLTFGVQRGLFLLSPFLLLAIPGFVWFAREKKWRAEFFLCLWATVSFILFNSSSAMWQGGFAVGPRYIVPMLPFTVVPIIFVMNRARALWSRLVIAALIILSFLMVWVETLGGQEYPQYQPFPFVQYSLPYLAIGDVARNFGMFVNFRGFASLIPLLILILCLYLAFRWYARGFGSSHTAPTEPHTALP